MDVRTAFNYMEPTTLANIIFDAIISIFDAIISIERRKANDDFDIQHVKEIVRVAWDAMVAKVGAEDAKNKLIDVGINYKTLELLWRYHE